MKIVYLLVLTLFSLSFTVRLYRLDNPVADWHSWRQADTAAVTRNFIKEGYNPFFPKFDSLNSLNEGNLPNPNRYFFAEFPLYNSFHYFSYTVFGHFSFEEWGRLISIIASSLTTVVLYFLVRMYSNQRVALMTAVFFAILPFNIYWGRVILPDPLHIFLSVLSLYLVSAWVKSNNFLFSTLAGIAYAGALLTKPYALILLLPIGYLLLTHWRFDIWKKVSFFVFIAVSLLPFLLWRWHVSNYPEGMFGTTWLYNQGDIRFTGAYFRWLIFERMNRLIFATGGFVLFFLGLIKGPDKKEGFFYYIWLFSVLVFFVIIAKGNVTHDYYQLPLVPIGAIFMAKGVDFLLSFGATLVQRLINIAVAAVLVALMLAFGWYEIRGYFNINKPAIVRAGQYVDKNLPKDAIVIAPYQNDSAFLYQTNRYGFTSAGGSVPQFIREGATHLVSVNYDDDTNYWMQKCKVLEANNEFVVISLRECEL